ncbi:hypothetical protein KKG36_02240, partial [Patescibacteria group bacterium]|nr:hypothetical protein [Patescibacteria group bacterium]
VLPPGDYELVITATDLAKNSATSTVFFTVLAMKINIVDKIVDFIFPEPEPIVNISKTAPEVMKGDWNIIPEAKVNKFVFDPLPREISALAQKFPKLSSTFKKLGIGKASDVSRLQSIKLTLPTLTQTTDLPSFTSIPLAKLTFSAKKKIPTEIVFVRAGAELVDFGVTLSLGDKGNIQQVTSIIANQPLRLVVKPEGSVNSVKGYILFKSKTPTISSIPLDSLTASLMFSEPKFAKQETPVIDQEFLINEFEYKDDDGDGIYIADILGPAVDAEYEIVTVIDYVNTGEKTIRMIALVDPEGYIYEREGNNEIRINGAIISLYWLDQERREYILWPAKDFNQQNPQTTDRRGTYSFLVPEGMYSLKVQAPGYLVYEGKPIEVKVGSGIHQNIELKTSFWLLKYLDWRTLILLLIGILLIYNFYRDIKKKI